jgi:hypothetical protein
MLPDTGHPSPLFIIHFIRTRVFEIKDGVREPISGIRKGGNEQEAALVQGKG